MKHLAGMCSKISALIMLIVFIHAPLKSGHHCICTHCNYIVICLALCPPQDIDLPGLATLTPKDYQSYVLLKVNLNVLDK